MENKKHCDVCNKSISKSNWAKHINTKSHRDRAQTTSKHSISTVQIFPPGPITRFPSSRHERRERRKIKKKKKQLKCERIQFLRELPFFRSSKRTRAKRKPPEYFDQEQGLNELPNDPEIFRPHHSESRDVGPYTIEPIERRDQKFGLRKSKYRIRLNPKYPETRASYDTIYEVLSEMVKMFRERTNFQIGDKFRAIILNEIFSNNGIISTPYITIESNEDEEIIEQLISSIAETLVKILSSLNVFIAAFTTSNARLRLYEKLDELGDRVCYYDTDSIVYVDDGSKTVKTGKCLGDWENDLKGDDYGIRWVSPGPKSYEMNIIKGDIKFRFKGFVLNYESGKIINGESYNIIKLFFIFLSLDLNLKLLINIYRK